MGKKRKGFQWQREDQPGEALEPVVRFESSAKNSDNEELSALAHRLIDLPIGRRARLPVDDELKEAITHLINLGGQSATRRQMLRVKHLLRLEDREAVAAFIDGDSDDAARGVNLIRWRQRIIDGGDAELQDFLERFPGGDRQRLRTLSRQARGEGQAAKRAAKRLLQELKAAGGEPSTE